MLIVYEYQNADRIGLNWIELCWIVLLPIFPGADDFFLPKSFSYGQIMLHPEFCCPRPRGSALKVPGGGGGGGVVAYTNNHYHSSLSWVSLSWQLINYSKETNVGHRKVFSWQQHLMLDFCIYDNFLSQCLWHKYLSGHFIWQNNIFWQNGFLTKLVRLKFVQSIKTNWILGLFSNKISPVFPAMEYILILSSFYIANILKI